MDKPESYRNLHFERRVWFTNPRLIAIGLALGLFILSWRIIPVNDLFFVWLLPVAGVVWAATYGWRQAFSTLMGCLRRIERFFSEASNDFK
jgi:hypothetical protein